MKTKLHMITFAILATSNVAAMDLFKPNQKFIGSVKPQPKVDNRKVPACLNKNKQTAKNFFYCPHPDNMYQIDGKWNAPPDWHSKQRSFSTKVTRFLGASWIGVNIGSVVCEYEGPMSTFPVQILSNRTFFKPTKARWSLEQSSDRSFKCYALKGDPCECGFSVYKLEGTTTDQAITEFMNIQKRNPAPYTSPFYGY